MDRQRIIAELKMERDRLSEAITALEGSTTVRGSRRGPRAGRRARRPHRLSPEGRRRLSEMMKRRWAERRKKASKAA